ncbi:MAG: biotin--[acetyl-CoA-carboxylase] ligase [Candidatus Gastranaerophilales bacterium]
MDIIFLEEVDSTNSYAKQNIKKHDDKTIIVAKRQTSGRGRLQRKWIDLGEGNIFCSIILKPSSRFNEIYSNLTQYLCVILCRILEQYNITPEIKWPNDILIDGEKIAGILCETIMQGENFNGLVLGFGINLKATIENLAHIDKKATALNLKTNNNINTQDFLLSIINAFFTDYESFLSNGFISIKEEYISKSNFLGKEISVNILNNVKTGLAKDITNKGELLLVKNNDIINLTIGEII